MRMKRLSILGYLLMAGLVGCVATQSDLSAPCRWQEIEGEPMAVATANRMLPIVTDEKFENRWAAWFLADTIEEMCGRRPPIVAGAVGSITNGLFVGVGNCDVGELGPEGFRVIARDGAVRFLGRADYAVFDWCERELGMRYYCPDGKCVEKREEIVVRAVDYSDKPVYEHRMIGGGLNEKWVRVARAGSVHRGGVAVHAPHRWFRDERLKALHPEIFETGETPMLCYGDPKTLEYYKLRIDRHIAGVEDSGGIVDTTRKVVTVSPWDAPIRCTCRYCRTLYGRGGRTPSASPIVWGWFLPKLASWLKTAHPDYMISFLPYLNYCSVPLTLNSQLSTLNSCEAEVCTMPGLALLKDESCKQREEDFLRGWQRVTGRKVLSWDYECWPKEFTSAPYVFGETVQAHYAELRDVLCGAYVCGSATDPRTVLSTYVWMKCLWNPDFDVEAVYDEFARRMFGPAEKPMRKLIALQEECWNRQWTDAVCSYRNIFEISYPPSDVKRMKTLMVEANGIALKAGEPFAGRARRYLEPLETFIAEAEANAARTERKAIRLNTTYELGQARSVWATNVWAKTEVTTRLEGDELCIRARCFEPAVKRLDFKHEVPDFIWGNDSVEFMVDDGTGVKTLKRGLLDAVSRDDRSWFVEARVKISATALQAGSVRGNVCRWRVGDVRHPEEERVPGSRYEHTRLDTRFTQPNDDSAAFVDFLLR